MPSTSPSIHGRSRSTVRGVKARAIRVRSAECSGGSMVCSSPVCAWNGTTEGAPGWDASARLNRGSVSTWRTAA
ncbi:hypothetical protein [Streptomyces sp. NPDC057301]|uniref:hypothetical protein n=1 Tax=Streptomyces sp. NPDC057301 TaxID=3346093 RepID=UPI00362A1790